MCRRECHIVFDEDSGVNGSNASNDAKLEELLKVPEKSVEHDDKSKKVSKMMGNLRDQVQLMKIMMILKSLGNLVQLNPQTKLLIPIQLSGLSGG